MAQNDIWMPWYIGDYLSKTMHLCTEQHGALLLLLAAYWTKKGPLPDDDSFLAGTTRLPLAVWKRHRTVLAGFFVIEDGFWRQSRAEEELAKAAEVSARRRAGGRRTAQRRWGGRTAVAELPANGSSAIAELHAQLPVSDSSAIAQLHLSNKQSGRHTHTHTPNTSPSLPQQEVLESGSSMPPDGGDEDEANGSGIEEPRPRSGPIPPDLLNQISAVWALYPKKIETLAAQIAIKNAIRQHGFEAVLEGTRAIVEADGRRNGAASRGRFLPRPTEFFESARFLDDPSQYAPRDVALEPGVLRKEIETLAAQVAEHPGNPDNTVGSLERKKAAAAEFQGLRARLIELRQQLAAANVEVEP